MPSEPIRTRIRRLYVPNAVYFITCVTLKRRPIFASESDLELLRETMRKVKEIHPFQMRAYAFLHDHFHLLIFVPSATDISKILHSIQRNFTLNYKLDSGEFCLERRFTQIFSDNFRESSKSACEACENLRPILNFWRDFKNRQTPVIRKRMH